jgi:hypothetical protein
MKYGVHRNFHHTVLTANDKPIYSFKSTQECADYISINLAGVQIEWKAYPEPMTTFLENLERTLNMPDEKPAIIVNGLTCEVRPIRRHKGNAQLIWIETPLGNQWADVNDITNLDLDKVPWD